MRETCEVSHATTDEQVRLAQFAYSHSCSRFLLDKNRISNSLLQNHPYLKRWHATIQSLLLVFYPFHAKIVRTGPLKAWPIVRCDPKYPGR